MMIINVAHVCYLLVRVNKNHFISWNATQNLLTRLKLLRSCRSINAFDQCTRNTKRANYPRFPEKEGLGSERRISYRRCISRRAAPRPRVRHCSISFERHLEKQHSHRRDNQPNNLPAALPRRQARASRGISSCETRFVGHR